ncbi:MAG: sirohydrochlorin chelatase [Magnetococcales bacterium]|nr:sirohydrochlorin chelatase [Magnetococcales bacterium]
MRETILLIGHGSRAPEGNAEVVEFVRFWRQRHPASRIEVCFIEFDDVLLDAGLEQAARDADRVLVIPLILNAAGHVKLEIPGHLDAARQRFPQVTFRYARPLGAEDKILELLRLRLHATMVGMDMPDPLNTGVILLARGSSDMGANAEVARMARWLYETTQHEWIDYAFTSITDPRLERMVQRQVRLGAMQVVVLPYYLFTGRLIHRIKRQVQRLQGQYPTITLVAAGYLGIHGLIGDLVDQRLTELRTGDIPPMACDGCRYRAIAQEHLDAHHHADIHGHHDHPTDTLQKP